MRGHTDTVTEGKLSPNGGGLGWAAKMDSRDGSCWELKLRCLIHCDFIHFVNNFPDMRKMHFWEM